MGQLDQGAARLEHDAAHLDEPSREPLEVDARKRALELGAAHAHGEVGAPVGAEVQIDVALGRRDPQHPAADDAEAARAVPERARVLRHECGLGPQPAPSRAGAR